MSLRNKTHLIILGMLIQLFLFSGLRAGEIPPGENESKQEVSGPEQHQMTLVSLEPWVVEGELLGLVAAYTYDDVSTERPADYWELYNNQGSLVAVSWFDKFGARRTAVDRGIVEGQTNSREFLLSFQTAARADENIQMPFGEHAIPANWRGFPPSAEPAAIEV